VSRPCRYADVAHFDFEADVVVIGFGAAGASAAIEAANAGARVALFEVASGSGGTSAMAGGDIYLGGGGGTRVQRANGFEDASADFRRYVEMAGGPDVDLERVQLYTDNALAHFEWLQAQGIPYRNTHIPNKVQAPGTGDCLIWSGSEDAWPFNLEAKPCPRGHLPEAVGEAGGKKLLDCLAARVHALGVEFHFDARAQALIADDARRVRGAVVRIDGQPRYARAKRGVILCAGGFALNTEMLRRHAPLALRLRGDSLSGGYDDGSGIELGQSVGGAAIHMDELFTTLSIYPPESHVKGILVNERGQRFINEDAYPGRIGVYCTRQIGDKIYLLVDDAIFGKPAPYSRIEVAAVGETWQELEREIGMLPGALVETVERYNGYAAKGEDPIFHKTPKYLKPLDQPPFAALACHVGETFYPYFTLGGLHTKPSGEVLTPERQPIPGLYAAGRNCCGLPRWAEGYSSGMSLGDCTFFGRQAGVTAAAAPVLGEA
jgi:succinate dehydrogenase/fumarate reductase flavoprotein subunit